MQTALKGISSIFKKNNPPPKKAGRKPFGQSLVEVAIAFPILIMLFTGVVEFGFILNFYLSLLDATREAARYWSNGDPFDASQFDATHGEDTFYYNTAYDVQTLLDPLIKDTTYVGRRIVLDPARDDVIISIYGAEDSDAILWRDDGPYHLLPTDGHPSGNYPSIFSEATIESSRVTDAPNAGFLVVELHYNYHHVLNLPWMTAFIPNPLHLQAYTIMPLRAAEPD